MKQMTGGHLDKDAMLRWQMGEAGGAERAHVADCARCRAETEPLKDALGWFGAAAREWGGEKAALVREWHDAKEAAALEWRESKSALRLHWRSMVGVWAAVAAVLLLIFGIGLPRHKAQQAPTTAQVQQPEAKQQITSDNALLEAVDQDVSREVPAALQPLTWSATSRQ